VCGLLSELSTLESVTVVPGGDQPEETAPNFSNFIFGELLWNTNLNQFVEKMQNRSHFDYLEVCGTSSKNCSVVIFYRNDTLPEFRYDHSFALQGRP
jgi:hypothetical protein